MGHLYSKLNQQLRYSGGSFHLCGGSLFSLVGHMAPMSELAEACVHCISWSIREVFLVELLGRSYC
jgi:hypothetical protein